MIDKRQHGRLRCLVERAIAEVCDFPRPGLWLCVDEINVKGNPPERIRVWSTLHFTAGGSPFCCGEPHCQLGLFNGRRSAIGDLMRKALRLRQPVEVFFGRIAVNYHAGTTFLPPIPSFVEPVE
jgi:hypothetical protein